MIAIAIALGVTQRVAAQDTPAEPAPEQTEPPAETAPASEGDAPAAESAEATGDTGEAPAQPTSDELPPALQRPAAFSWEESPEASAPTEPLRIIAQIGGGASLRLVRNLDFGQKSFAPSYVDVLGGAIFPGSGTWRHGAGLNVSVNVTGDGTFEEGFDGFRQWTLAPTYIAYLRFSNDILVLGKASVAFTVNPDVTVGAELAGAFNYLLFAGLGLYGELGFSLYGGGGGSVHPLLSLEAGVTIDYEVLP